VIAFPVPVDDIVTLFPLTGLPSLSLSVMVTVAPVVLSVETGLGGAAIVDTLAETGPAMKVTVAVLVKVMLPSVTVAVMVLVSALVDLMVAVV
jgi:hypothetical protein